MTGEVPARDDHLRCRKCKRPYRVTKNRTLKIECNCGQTSAKVSEVLPGEPNE